MVFSKQQMVMIKKLGQIEVEIQKLKAMVLSTVKPTKRDIKAMEAGQTEISKGEWVCGRDLTVNIMK